MERITHITKYFRQSGGSHEGLKVYTITGVNDGETEVVIEKTISERYPVQKLNEVLEKAEILDGGNGRRCITIDDIYAISTHNNEISGEVKKMIK